MDNATVQGSIPEREYVRQLFNLIGEELEIQANLITSKEFSKQNVYGWAHSIKGINWIYINFDRIAKDYFEFGRHGGIKLEGIPWKVNSIDLVLFYTIIHEYTHLMGNPVSVTGLSEDDYFQIFAPLGDREQILRALHSEPSTEGAISEQKIRNEQLHDDNFFTFHRVNVYRCGKLLAELKAGAKG